MRINAEGRLAAVDSNIFNERTYYRLVLVAMGSTDQVSCTDDVARQATTILEGQAGSVEVVLHGDLTAPPFGKTRCMIDTIAVASKQLAAAKAGN